MYEYRCPARDSAFSVSLFFVHCADCRNQHENTPVVKSVDATGLTGLMTRDDDSHYRQQISDFVDWCDENYLQMWEVKNLLFFAQSTITFISRRSD